MDKIRFIKREYTTWEDFKGICLPHTEYKLQYQKSFLGINYWKTFTETLCGGMGDCFTTPIFSNSKEELLKRYNCAKNKDKYIIEYETKP